MGYYIQVPNHKGKAQQLVDLYGATYGATIVDEPPPHGQGPGRKTFWI